MRQLNTHVEKTAEFSTNPLLGIEKKKEMFHQTYKAMDTMDRFRTKAIEAMGKNNQIMQGEIERARTYIERVRPQQAREELASDPKLAGPVAL